MKRTMIAANWKMHFDTSEASILIHHLNKVVPALRLIEVVLAPPLLTLQPISNEIDRRKFRLASQNAFFQDEGAYTGEVSFTMLRDLVHYSIIGHSERRIYFNEDLPTVKNKVTACIRNGINPILCIGENKAEKVAGRTKQVIHDQLTTAISNLTGHEVSDMVIAYEPVWAISTFGGEVAQPTDIQKILDYIRFQISELFGAKVAQNVRILYGGSVNADSVSSYLALDGCDGALIGGASLKYLEFAEIINKAYILRHQS